MAAAGVNTRYRDRPNYETDDELCEDMFCFVTLLATACLSTTTEKKTKTKKKKRFWVQPYLKQRPIKPQITNNVPNPELTAPNFSPENFHMSSETFHEIARKIQPFMISRKSKRPDRISDLHRLAITLDFLANSIQQKHLAQNHHISKQVLGVILDEVCSALINGLKRESTPVMSRQNWLQIAKDFDALWNFPLCLGAVGAKYVDVEYPRNYQTVSTNGCGILVTGVADARYRFIRCDVATCDSAESGVDFSRTGLGKWLVSVDDVLEVACDRALDGEGNLPFVFVTDDACPLGGRVIKAFRSGDEELSKTEAMFNDRLNHANLAIENAFGILASKWRCLSKRLVLKPDRAKLIVEACCVLHNYLITQTTHHDYCSSQFADHKHQNNLINGEWRQDSASNSMLNSRVAFHAPTDESVNRANETRQILMNSLAS